MGISSKSHGKKSDKETQSPMLKIFKEIMQRENRDPEKTNLLKEKQENKKRKQYSGSRSKDHKSRTSSSSDYCKESAQYKVALQQHKDDNYSQYKSQSIPFQNEKRDSWWLWGDQEKKKSEETRSCVSCALKMFSTQYAGVICLLLLFAVTVLITFLLVFRTIPVLSEGEGHQDVKSTKYKNKMDGDHLKKKINTINRNHDFGYGPNDFPGQTETSGSSRAWSDLIFKDLDGLSAISGPEFGETDFRESNVLEDPEKRVFADLSNVLDKEKIGDGSDRLKSFYLKLLETDANIKKLKKGIFDHNYYNTMGVDNNNNYLNNIQNRLKRSLKHSNKTKASIEFRNNENDKPNNAILKRNANIDINKNYIFYPPYTVFKRKYNFNNTERKKREDADEPSGFVIEKKKVIVQYNPEQKKKFPKCSHAPKESKSHEKQLKHPFYKNTQRLDELLDNFLDKKFPELITDPFRFDAYFKNKKEKCKHDKVFKNKKYRPEEHKLKTVLSGTHKSDTEDPYHAEKHSKYLKEFFSNHFDFGKNLDRKYTAKPNNGVLLSVSTLVNPDSKKVSAATNFTFDVLPNIRRLMQVDDEDEETLGYEDFNEVLADDMEAHDETDKQRDRKKRMNILYLDQSDPQKHIPGVYNPNWKGPMLYPDELKTMIKQAVINNLRVKMPINNKVASEGMDRDEINDVDYMEEYLSNKYDKLANMAQAYSDYGVFDGKKDIFRNDKHQEKSMEHRVKLSVDKRDFPDATLFGHTEKDPSTSEGIRFEYRKQASEEGLDVLKTLQKHLKFTNNEIFLHDQDTASSSNSGSPSPPELEILYTPTTDNYYRDDTTAKAGNLKEGNKIIVPMGKLKRTLKSLDLEEDLIEDNEEVKNRNKKEAESSANANVNENLNKTDKMTIAPEVTKEIDKKSNDSNIGMNFGDFLAVMSDWFSTLASLDGSGDNKGYSTNIINLLPMSNKSAEISKQNATDILMSYPIYDSDMIENIGHRSRVLMAVDDKAINMSESDKGKTKMTTEDTSEKNNDVTSVVNTTNVIQATDISANSSTNITQSKRTDENTQTEKVKNININNTRSVFKRSVPEDSNLIFWNDIYDDEYGVKIDPFDGITRDKHSAKNDNVMKKSQKWIENKVKGIADSIRGKVLIDMDSKKRNIRGADSYETDHLDSESFQNKINAKIDNTEHPVADDMETDVKSDFKALTAHMERVCQEAVKAVQNTRNLAVREDNSEGGVATSLMNQLVRLMSDLVDYQVQQRTCLKLPEDLRDFLDWLTTPDQQDKYDYGKLKNSLQDEGLGFLENLERNDHQTELDSGIWTTSPSDNEQDIYDTRSQCLGSIHAVQDLMRQYDDMSDIDKEKMLGVKEYLSNQLEYLNKQLSNDEYNVLNLYQKNYLPIRIRRDLSNRRDHNRRSNKDQGRSMKRLKKRRKRKQGKFIRNFGNKHTKSTASNIDLAQMITGGNKKIKRYDPESEIDLNVDPIDKDDTKFNADKTADISYSSSTKEDDEIQNPKMKRNLKDVYYKALAESKKYTTVKNMHKTVKISN